MSIKTIKFFAGQARFLSLPYEEQYKELHFLGDYMTDDIASDWIFPDSYKKFNKEYGENIISERASSLYEAIDRNFYDISLDGHKYDEIFWTLEGLKNHPLWNEQRRLAKELLNELEKIE